MNKMKRPAKITFEIVAAPTALQFADKLASSKSIYIEKLNTALGKGQVIAISQADKYLVYQLKAAAKKINCKLVYAVEGERLYIKPILVTADLKRLLYLLREPRTMNELRAAKLEIALENELSKLAGDGMAHIHKDKWVLTEKGLDTL